MNSKQRQQLKALIEATKTTGEDSPKQRIIALLRSGLEGTTKQIATAAKTSVSTALKVLHDLEAAEFELESGGNLMHSEENTTGRGQYTELSPTKYYWFFQ